jgi:hypothetical protein
MASKRHQRWKACGRKAKYTKREAIGRAKYLRATKDIWVNAYQCKYCGGWHVGHPTRAAKHGIRMSMREKRSD